MFSRLARLEQFGEAVRWQAPFSESGYGCFIKKHVSFGLLPSSGVMFEEGATILPHFLSAFSS